MHKAQDVHHHGPLAPQLNHKLHDLLLPLLRTSPIATFPSRISDYGPCSCNRATSNTFHRAHQFLFSTWLAPDKAYATFRKAKSYSHRKRILGKALNIVLHLNPDVLNSSNSYGPSFAAPKPPHMLHLFCCTHPLPWMFSCVTAPLMPRDHVQVSISHLLVFSPCQLFLTSEHD